MRLKFELKPELPLFPSRQRELDGTERPVARSQAHDLIKAVFAQAGIADDGRLGTHSLRKTFAKNAYLNGGRDIMLLKRALGHADVSATQRYLEVEEDAVMAAISRCDFTSRTPRATPARPALLAFPGAFCSSAVRRRSRPTGSCGRGSNPGGFGSGLL